MKNNLFMNYDTVDKASHLREGHILNHKDFDINKIKLTKIWQNKFSVKKINEKIFEIIETQECKNQLIANTSWAVEKGAFGIPTFLIDDQIFFGKDHMYQLEEYINSKKE